MPVEDTQTAIEFQAKQVEARRNLTSVPFNTAIELQSLIVTVAKSGQATPSALAQLARAWSDLEDRKRIIKMKPAPKPIDVTPKVKRTTASSGFSESPAAAKPKRVKQAPSAPVELGPPTDTPGETSKV